MSNKVIKKIRVKCSGHFHEIGLNQKGQLMFFTHTKEELKAEQALCELGAEPCGCLKFLEKWRKKQFYKKEFNDEAEEIRNKRTKRLINNSTRQQIKIIDLQQIKKNGRIKEYQKLYIELQMNLSIQLAERILKKKNAQIINTYIYAVYDYLGNFNKEIDITFIYLNNTFSILFHYAWWKIYKNFKGGIIDNKILTYIEGQTADSYIVSAIDLLVKHKHYKIEINKNLQNWRVLKEEIYT